MKIREFKILNEVRYIFYCPGCKYHHSYRTVGPQPTWQFNGDLDKPTFSPSLLYELPRCHIFVTDGKIIYLSDCSHNLAGKTIEMEDESV